MTKFGTPIGAGPQSATVRDGGVGNLGEEEVGTPEGGGAEARARGAGVGARGRPVGFGARGGLPGGGGAAGVVIAVTAVAGLFEIFERAGAAAFVAGRSDDA